MQDILSFIASFQKFDVHGDVKALFTEGKCYWFAKILQERFGGSIIYDPIEGHFSCRVAEAYYDITGPIIPQEVVEWETYEQVDSSHYRRIVRDCIQ